LLHLTHGPLCRRALRCWRQALCRFRFWPFHRHVTYAGTYRILRASPFGHAPFAAAFLPTPPLPSRALAHKHLYSYRTFWDAFLHRIIADADAFSLHYSADSFGLLWLPTGPRTATPTSPLPVHLPGACRGAAAVVDNLGAGCGRFAVRGGWWQTCVPCGAHGCHLAAPLLPLPSDGRSARRGPLLARNATCAATFFSFFSLLIR